jgi:hypothetical protein
VSVVGMGATGGTTWNDGECVRRLNARELNNMGFHTEACLLLRVDKDVEAAFQRSGNHCDNWTPPQASNAQQPPQQPQAKEAAPRPPNPTAQPSTPPPQASAAAQAAPQAPTGFLAQNGAAYGSPSTPVPYYQLPAYEAQAEATPASSGSPPQ